MIVVVSALLFALRGPIADLFQAEGLTRDLVYLFCGPLALLFFFNGVIFVGNAVCNNLGAAVLVHGGELGAAHAGDDALRAVARARCGARRAC